MPFDDAVVMGALRPIIEVMTNRDFFRDKYIIPPWQEPLELRFRDTTEASRLGQALQQVFGADARKIDHFIRTQFSGTGGLVLSASDIGRADKPATAAIQLNTLFGIFSESPALQSVDARHVFETIRRYNLSVQSSSFRRFQDLIQKYGDARTSEERDRLAAAVRDEASRLRRQVLPKLTEEKERRVESGEGPMTARERAILESQLSESEKRRRIQILRERERVLQERKRAGI
jgi:hypothetical protein